jgi:glutamate racemase
MKTLHNEHPIGIFDSGIGGLTVAKALVNYLPNENIIYFGDTAHLPYGDKSTAAIQAYAIKIVQMLLQQECKLILIACNSATAAAGDLVKEYVRDKALIINVIDPTVRLLKEKYVGKRIGLIGTRQTVSSNIYQRKMDEQKTPIHLTSYATGLLASAIEEFGNHKVIDTLLETYLTHPDLKQLDALVLACTHYPIIKDKIINHYQKRTEIVDSVDIVVLDIIDRLRQENLLNPNRHGQKQFYVSDYTESFAKNARLFFSDDIVLTHYPLWD